MYDEIPDYRYRLIDYVGDDILIGSSLGSPFYFIKGLYNSPGGGRLAGGVHAVHANVPLFAGRLAGRLAVFSAMGSGMSLARGRKEDPWNTIVAGTGTLGLVNLHRGAPAAARAALLAAAFFIGMAFADFSFDDWHSRLIRSGGEVRIHRWLPALIPRASPCRAALRDAAGGSVEENRSENGVTPDLFAMEHKLEMTSKDA
ncbi:unnamed protein product [Urochloa decumbens]|uniref:Uncharacterized protein n=1 Tax=Urochloa decumbens TaxID=240449 RepID=A0ABC9BUR0_9POAL